MFITYSETINQAVIITELEERVHVIQFTILNELPLVPTIQEISHP